MYKVLLFKFGGHLCKGSNCLLLGFNSGAVPYASVDFIVGFCLAPLVFLSRGSAGFFPLQILI